jgi:hypothetical protein
MRGRLTTAIEIGTIAGGHELKWETGRERRKVWIYWKDENENRGEVLIDVLQSGVAPRRKRYTHKTVL